MKKIILLTLGIGDFFFAKESAKIEGQENYVNLIKTITHRDIYSGVVNVTIPSDKTDKVDVFEGIRPQAVSKLTLFSDNMLHINNELSLLSLSDEVLRFHGNQLDFIFRPQDYDIHVCGLDVNGVMTPGIAELLRLGFNVTLYSDTIKPFKNTYKQINKLLKNPNFTYCSHKAVL